MGTYWAAREYLQILGWILIIGFVLVLWVVWKLPLSRRARVMTVLALMGAVLGYIGLNVYQAQMAQNEWLERVAKQKAIFADRCKSAGIKVYRQVADVEEIALINPRRWSYQDAQYNKDWEFAGAPSDSSNDDYIGLFLKFERLTSALPGSPDASRPRQRSFVLDVSGLEANRGAIYQVRRGFRRVYVLDGPSSGVYELRDPTGRTAYPNLLERYGVRSDLGTNLPRYALVQEAVADREGRDVWVAGTRTKVIDRQSLEIVGEWVQYARSLTIGPPKGQILDTWASAETCGRSQLWGGGPKPAGLSDEMQRVFLEQVISIKQGG